jgi:hypothetical protein
MISNRHPLAPAALPAFFAIMGASDFLSSLFPSLLFRLVGTCADYAPTRGSPGLLPILIVWLEAAYDPGWSRHSHHNQGRAVACWRLDTIGPFQCGHFGTLPLHGRHDPLPWLLACFRAYASSALLPVRLQGSIPSPWLAVTGAGFSPAGMCSIAQPQPKPNPVNVRCSRSDCGSAGKAWSARDGSGQNEGFCC